MLEFYFTDPHTLSRLRSGPTSPYLDGYAQWLHHQGYSRFTARGYLRAVVHLGAWMTQCEMEMPSLSEPVQRDFLAHWAQGPGPRGNRGHDAEALAGTAHFLAYLQGVGVVSAPAPPQRKISELLARFETWMFGHRGVRESTLVAYQTILIEFITTLGSAPSAYEARKIRQFVMERARRHGRSRAKTTVTAVRIFLRFCAVHGLCGASLADAVPTIAEWRLSSLPQYASPDVVEQLIGSCDSQSLPGIRDRAILLLLARLGLRAGDVAALKGRDIDWSAATLQLSGKGRREVLLPLPQDVGDALLAYLEQSPPRVAQDRIFLRLRAPHGPLKTSCAIANIVNRAVRRAGVKMPRTGAHVLRHSAATTWVRQGLSLDGVGALLRHRSIETTAHYAKVNVEQLRRVAQPWPVEVAPC